jgi:hypothetical protein
LNDPDWLVMTGGKLWTAVGNYQSQTVVGVNPSSGAVTPLPGTYYDADLAVSPGDPNTLFLDQDGLSPGSVYRFDVATTPATQVAANTFTDQENIEDLAVSSDGKRVVPASGAPYLFEELSATTLQPDGLRYPGEPYPSAVAVSPAGLLATGLTSYLNAYSVAVYPLGAPAAVFSAETADDVASHGVALSANGKTLFAVTTNTFSNNVTFYAWPLERTSTSVSCSPTTLSTGQSSACTATVAYAGTGTADTPTGTVYFASSPSGSFSPTTHCALVPAPGPKATCTVTYKRKALATGSITIKSAYAGDAAHMSSSGTATLHVG